MEYAGHFWKVAHRTATMKTCSWSSTGEAWQSPSNPCFTGSQRSPLNLSGLAFRMELVTVPAHIAPEVAASAHKAPEAAVPSHTAPEVVASAHGSPKGDGARSHPSRGGGDRSQSSQSLMPVPRPSRADNQRAGSSADVCCERLCLLVSYPRRW